MVHMPRPNSAPAHRAQQGSQLVINLSNCKYELLQDVAPQLNYSIYNGDEETGWDLCWTDLSVSLERVSRLFCFQKLNHFPGMLEICRKSALARHVSRMAVRCPRQYDFYPPSLLMPEQLDDLVAALKRNKKKIETGTGEPIHWILKPSAGAQGRGINLVQTAAQLRNCDISNSIAQQYVANPLLLDGFKFDLRIYALVSSVDPLVIYMFDEGLARLATVPYEPPSISNLGNNCMHLTNYAVNKHAPGFVSSDSVAPGHVASKRLASVVLQQVAQRAGTTKEALVKAIESVVIKTVICIQPHLAHTYHTALTAGCQPGSSHSYCTTAGYCHGMLRTKSSSDAASAGASEGAQVAGARTSTIPPLACGCPPSQCFELLGFDILLDEDLQPHLLEVNHSPSFACDSKLDRSVKSALIYDVLAAQGQTVASKQEWHAAQNQAQVERLYKLSKPPKHQPLRVPLNGKLSEVAAGLDEIAGETGAPRPVRIASSRSGREHPPRSDAVHSHASKLFSNTPPQQTRPTHEIDGSVGLFNPQDTRQRVGLLTRVFPPVDVESQRTYATLLAAAADAFPDQRCQCAYCKRRQRVQYVQTSATHLLNAARSMVQPLATHAVGGGRMFAASASPRPMSRSMQRHVTTKLLEALEEEQLSGNAGGSVTRAAAPQLAAPQPAAPQLAAPGQSEDDSAAATAKEQPPGQSPKPPVHPNTAASRQSAKQESDAFMKQLASRAWFRSSSARPSVSRPASDEVWSPDDQLMKPSSTSASSDRCSNLTLKLGTSLSSTSYSDTIGTVRCGTVRDGGQHTSPGAGVQGTSTPPKAPLPRVATLPPSSARRMRSRQGSCTEVEAELLAMRMRTAAMLSNPFVSLCVSPSLGTARAHVTRSGSARRARGQAGGQTQSSSITSNTPQLLRAQSARL